MRRHPWLVRAEVYTLRAASDAGTVKIVIDGAAFTREHGPSWTALRAGILFLDAQFQIYLFMAATQPPSTATTSRPWRW
jgi:hypothetical protein